MLKRRPGTIDPSTLPPSPIPPTLEVKLRKVFLGPKHRREMQPSASVIPNGLQWKWEPWVDTKGNEYVSVKHGRNEIWYKIERTMRDEPNIDTLYQSSFFELDPSIE